MKLTPIFNAAAHGDGDGHAPIDRDPQPPSPIDRPAAAMNIQPGEEQNSSPVKATGRQFEAAARPVPDVVNEPTDSGLSEKEAVLDMLERGRAKPKAAHNLKPSPHVEKAVHAMTEERREKLIRDLRRELLASDDFDQLHVLDEEFDDDFGPTF